MACFRTHQRRSEQAYHRNSAMQTNYELPNFGVHLCYLTNAYTLCYVERPCDVSGLDLEGKGATRNALLRRRQL